MRVRKSDFAFELTYSDAGADVLHDGRRLSLAVVANRDRVGLARNGRRIVFSAAITVAGTQARSAPTTQSDDIVVPMPGIVTELKASADVTVRAGETVAVMEVMKLVMPLVVGADGKVLQVKVAAGQSVAAGNVLMEIERAPPRAV